MDFILAIAKWIKSDPSYLILALIIGWMFKMLRDKDIYIDSLINMQNKTVKTLGDNTETLATLTALIEVLVHRGGDG